MSAISFQGAIQAYQSIVPSLTFSGPTYIAPVLRKVINITKTETSDVEQSPQNYYVLLIITVGVSGSSLSSDILFLQGTTYLKAIVWCGFFHNDQPPSYCLPFLMAHFRRAVSLVQICVIQCLWFVFAVRHVWGFCHLVSLIKICRQLVSSSVFVLYGLFLL